MRLTELDPHFIIYRDRVEPREFVVGDPLTWRAGDPTERRIVTVRYQHDVDSFVQAQGIRFLCPKCFTANRGPIGTHGCEVTFEGRGVGPGQGSHNAEGHPVRWTVSGTGYADLTTHPSIALQGGCNWHGWITNGQVT